MLIPLSGPADGQLREWALVELQGKIEPQGDADVTQGLVVGAMQLAQSVSAASPPAAAAATHACSASPCAAAAAHSPHRMPLKTAARAFPACRMLLAWHHRQSGQELVQLQIGYHVLEGKRLPLKKPLAILEQQKGGCSSSEGGGGGGDDASSSGGVVCKASGRRCCG